MAEKKYYTIEEAASFLGITPAEVNLRRERNELRGLRDGPNWKFKAEDVESLARRIRSQEISAAADDDTNEVLLSELALGGSNAGRSGTVIGGKAKSAADSDLRLAESDVKLGGSGVKKAGSGLKKQGSGVGSAAAAPDLDLTIDENLLLDDDLTPEPKKPASGSGKKSGSAIGQKPGSGIGRKADDAEMADRTVRQDDDLVLAAASGTGSDVTIGSDSGISLVDPTDSGLSLEEPLELETDADDDSLELGEDDMLTFAEEPEAATAAKVEEGEGFQLTPLEDTGDEDSESGSQVIALEGAAVSEVAPTMIAGGAAPVAAAMLDEDFAGMGEAVGVGPAVPAAGGPLGLTPAFADQAAIAVAPTVVVAEAPYTGLQITSLVVCIIFLILCGWMGYDLLRNMWSWNGAYTVNSSLMDFIVGLFG